MADKHTPGPLAVWPSLYEGYAASVVVDGSDPLRTLAQVREYRDAILYAGAPDMFEALTALVSAARSAGQHFVYNAPTQELAEAIDAGIAALAKAGGE